MISRREGEALGPARVPCPWVKGTSGSGKSVESRALRTAGKSSIVAIEEPKSIQRRVLELQTEHRDLDEVVNALSLRPDVDQLLLRRMKKRKLQLKDQIARLKSQLIPDLDA